MLRHLINKIKNKLRRTTRSGHWPVIRNEHLEKNPTCAACAGTIELNVHHIRPFHLDPELELDPDNLITLCMGKLDCHIVIGHGSSFKAYNPDVVEDARFVLESTDREKTIKELAPKIKQKRKM